MQLSITFRHMDPSDFLREYAREKVERVNKFFDRAGEAHVVLSLERHLHHAEIQIQSGRWILRGREKSEDMYASIDLAMEKIERQLRRHKERLKNHHSKEFEHHQEGVVNHHRLRNGGHASWEVAAAEEEEDRTPRVIRTNEFLSQALTAEEAIMQMDLMNADFYAFTNAVTKAMNVVYRRKDGHYGLIEADAVR
jgi:putative sigma-54 modulation protein